MNKCIFCIINPPLVNTFICDSCRNKYNLSEDDNQFINHFLSVSFNEYTAKERAICMSSSAEPIIGDCRRFLNDLIITLYGDSNAPLDILAVAMTYARMYAAQRPLAIIYFEKFRQNFVEIPKIYHLAYNERRMLNGREAYSLWSIFSKFANIYEAEKQYTEAILCLQKCIAEDKGTNPADFERIKKIQNKLQK